MDRLKVYIIGATGLVGQRYVQLLADHPWFEVVGLAASEKSAGKRLAEAGWVLDEAPPPSLADMKIEKLDVDKVPKVDFVFSALPSEVAAKVEPALAARGHVVLSNSSNMLVGTLGIGLLPGYAEIGILASVGVFILRIIQGLALGGGYGAAITYLGEFVPEHRRGFFTGFLFTTPAAGMKMTFTSPNVRPLVKALRSGS